MNRPRTKKEGPGKATLYAVLGVLGALLVLLLAACGSSSSSSSTAATTAATAATTASTPAATTSTSASSSPALAGTGKPPVVIGDKNFPEENLLGALYAQALEAKGYKVTLKDNIGASEITYKALTAGQIEMYPEYTGTLLATIYNVTKNPTSAAAAYAEAARLAAKAGLTLLAPTPFFDSDALAVLKSYGTAHHLASIPDLVKLGSGVSLGGAPEFATRTEGLLGLRSVYGFKGTFKPIAINLSYQALDSGQVNTQDVFTTDGQLSSGKYTLLADPKFVFGFQNVAPVVKQSVLAAEGPVFSQTLNAVSALLTTTAIQKMNAAISLDHLTPASVATTFLKANHLV
jgi:osmoprotectant transport system substrate-binding protein